MVQILGLIFGKPMYLWFLLSLPVFIIAHFFTLKYVKGSALKFANFEAIRRVSKGRMLAQPYSGKFFNKNLGVLFIRLLVITFLIFSVAGTSIEYIGETSDFDYVLAIDVSSSMITDDFEPNRLEAAKKAANVFLDSVSGKVNIGIVSFSGSPVVEQELISDNSRLREVVDLLDIGELGGTNIGGAIVTSSNLFVNEDKSKVIVLLTDGQANVGTSVKDAVDNVKSKNIRIDSIGVGTEEGGLFAGFNVTLKLDEEALAYMADETSGNYFKADNFEKLSSAFKEIASSTQQKMQYDLSFILLLLSLIIIFIQWGLINIKYRTMM